MHFVRRQVEAKGSRLTVPGSYSLKQLLQLGPQPATAARTMLLLLLLLLLVMVMMTT